MTEKQYGGASSVPQPKSAKTTPLLSKSSVSKAKSSKKETSQDSLGFFSEEELETSRFVITEKINANLDGAQELEYFNAEVLDKLKKAGEISKKVKYYIRPLIKQGIPLLEIAEKIEEKIVELGGKPAFPVNLSINEIAAHFTPSFNETATAQGLLKVDLGVHIDGMIADTAFSLDLESSEENKALIKAAEEARDKALRLIKFNSKTTEIGREIEQTIHSFGFQPITNLSGHSIEPYNLHSGITISNHENSTEKIIEEGIYAIEPFATTGVGKVIDGKPSGIYMFEKDAPVRDPFAREVLAYIKEEYKTLPFCSRWLCKKFGTRALIALKRIEEAKILHHYLQLIEQSRKKVAQAEHTVIITKKEKIITT